jgi:hypothetical protein
VPSSIQFDIDAELAHEPARHLAHGEAVAHRHRSRSDEALPTGAQREALDRAPRRVRAVEHPHRLAEPAALLEHIAERGDEGVDAATEILQVDEQRIAVREHRIGGSAHLAVEAEHRDAERGVAEVRRLDHVVLLVAAQPVLRPESRGDGEPRRRGQRIQRMPPAARARLGHGGRMREQAEPLAFERRAQRRLVEQPVDAEADGRHAARLNRGP